MPLPPGGPSSGAASPGAPKYVHGEIDALPLGTRLAEFEILRVLGMGGFGIVYLALDTQLQRQVALKEYLPASMAGRTEAGNVTVRSRLYAEPFSMGLRSFVNEARLLARFDNPSLVKVHRFWEANGTAYMVMPYYDGATLKAVRQSMNSPPDEAWLRRVLDSLLGALEVMHTASVYHRDVAPDNILLLRSGQPVLLDFGAARHVLMGQTQTLTAMLKPAYAPIEQYAEASEFRQGPWTDIYATAATLHYCLTGRAPPTAAARAVHDSYEPLRLREDLKNPPVGRACDPAWLAALDWGLEVKPQARPQSVAQWREVLAGRAPIPVTLSLPEADPDATVRLTVQDLQGGAGAAPVPFPETLVMKRGAAAASRALPAARRMSFRQMLPWILWLLAALAVAGAALYFKYVGPPPLPAIGGLGMSPAASDPAVSAKPAAIDEKASLIPPDAQIVASAPAVEAAHKPASEAASAPAGLPPVAAEQPAAVEAASQSAAASAPTPSPTQAATAASTPVALRHERANRVSVNASAAGEGSTQPPAPEPTPAPRRLEETRAERVAARREAVPEPAGPSSPREACGNRILISLWSCMRENCNSSRWSKHPQCVEWHRMEQRNSPQN